MSTDPRRGAASRPSRPGPAGRRFGYAVAVIVNVALLVLVNVWPTWREVPFLTEAMLEVLGLVNLGLIVGAIANLVDLVFDRRWIRTAGDLVGSVIAVITLWRFWEVFPFDFPDTGFDWALLVRILLVVAIIGTVIGVVVQAVILVRVVLGRPARGEPGEPTS
ncbi:hypothetical protein ACFPER_17490 [Agromyces aurantiacus]|uniref:Uncharacterized protein n=1 Tax=Agromyces aurantiacus TaxID=165814 RepID=A0ABV9REL7_9MICO|nr:hypothetical protein [Agromyces aurantiacus]MBM7505282.1 hypothetical protein [Agromyces aurantiacus]